MDHPNDKFDYAKFANMTKYEVRDTITKAVCAKDQIRHQPHLETPHLIEQFNQSAASGNNSILVMASRPFSNLNNLRSAYAEIPYDVVKTWKWF
jgi:hypothetical protein